jgi:hypothetical protein
MTDAYGAQLRRQLAEAREQLAEARIWARHGYEIGQRHYGWTDHGVAPEWLTEGWPAHVPGCESQAELTTLHEGEEPYEDEWLVPTPGQWIWLWNRATAAERLAKAQRVLGLHDIVDRYRAEAIQAAERGDHQLPVRLAAVRAAVHIADDEDVTDWQRGYRACANRVLAAFGGPAEQTAACCVCGEAGATYFNYLGLAFCSLCADCRCGETPCVRERSGGSS